MFDAWNERRPGDTTHLFDEYVVWDVRRAPAPDFGGGVYYGLDAVRSFWAEWLPQWDHIHGELVWVEERGERVVTWIHQAMRAHASGVELDIEYSYEFIFRDDKIIRVTFLMDEDEAKRSAGLG